MKITENTYIHFVANCRVKLIASPAKDMEVFRPFLLNLRCHSSELNPPPPELRSSAGHGLLILEVSRPHTTVHHSRWDSSGRVISSSQSLLSDNTQQSQQTSIHPAVGIRTHNPSRRAAADLRLRPCVYWNRPLLNQW